MNGGGGSGLAQVQADLLRVRSPGYQPRRFTRSDWVLGALALLPLPTLYLINWLMR